MPDSTEHDPELARLQAALFASKPPAPIAFPENVGLPLHVQDEQIRIIGRRISLLDIVDMYNEGAPADYIARRYELHAGDVHLVIGWYLHNQDVVDAYNAAWAACAVIHRAYWEYKNRDQTERLKALKAAKE